MENDPPRVRGGERAHEKVGQEPVHLNRCVQLLELVFV